MLSSGKILNQGDVFYVGVHIENYDSKSKTGRVCIRDSIDDYYGGIISQGNGECAVFNVKAAEIIKKETSNFLTNGYVEEVKPGVAEVYFPTNSMYSYKNLPSLLKPHEGIIQVSLNYRQTSQITATITVPDEHQPILVQEPSPIYVSAVKSIHRMQDAYTLNLELLLKKQTASRIFSPDFLEENKIYFRTELAPKRMSCSVNGESVADNVIFENERLIKCSSIINLAGEALQSYPLIITLDYGVALEKQYPFGIEVSEKA